MTPIPPVITGNHELVSWLNQARRCLEERTPLDSVECPIDKLPGGFRPKPKAPPEAGGGEVEQFMVTSVHRDHLHCKRATWRASDGNWDLEDEVIRIAKPDELRKMGWDTTGLGVAIGIDGYQYAYEAGGTDPDESVNPNILRTTTLMDGADFGADSVDYTEEVWPAYIAGRTIIYATRVTQKPIFVLTQSEDVDGVPTDVSYDIEWVDLNVGARTWKPKYRKLRVCVEGSTGPWFITVRASDSFNES